MHFTLNEFTFKIMQEGAASDSDAKINTRFGNCVAWPRSTTLNFKWLLRSNAAQWHNAKFQLVFLMHLQRQSASAESAQVFWPFKGSLNLLEHISVIDSRTPSNRLPDQKA